MSQPRIYLDHAATTPILPAAKAAMMEAMERWANPSSPHAEGRAARAALEDARARIKRALGWDGHVIFTSGASEAIDIALNRAKGGRRLLSAVEHDAVFRAAPGAVVLPVDDSGEVELERLIEELEREDRPVVAVQHVNSETGKIQPLDEISRTVRAAGGILLSDCAQSASKIDSPDADMVVVSAHKLGGPPGIGALLVRDLTLLEASGGQEQGYRGGTESVPAIAGFAAALEAFDAETGWFNGNLFQATGEFAEAMIGAGAQPIGGSGDFAGYIQAWAMPHLSAAAQLVRFDLAGFAISAGSACSSGSLRRSRVLTALDVPDDVADRTIRISLGWTTRPEDLVAFYDVWREIAEDARKRAA